MGLILKWREMREKMKHYRRHVRIRNSTVCGRTYLQVLDKVVEYTQTLRVLTVRDVHERTNLGSLPGSCETGKSMIMTKWRTSNATCSFPIRTSSSCFPTTFFFGQFVSSSLRGSQHAPLLIEHPDNVLRDLARLNNALKLLHYERSDPHYEVRINSCVWSVWGDDTHSLSG